MLLLFTEMPRRRVFSETDCRFIVFSETQILIQKCQQIAE
jgi:hypothetical protein